MNPPWAKVAAGSSFTLGFGFGLPAVYGTRYFAQSGEVWYFLGLPTYGDGPFESVGIPTSVPLLAGFVGVCATELVVGVLLWKRPRSGLWLSLLLLPFEMAYWLGFALPFGPVLGAIRTFAAIASVRHDAGTGRTPRHSTARASAGSRP